MYIGGDIVSKYDEESDIFILYDKTTKQPIEQIQMYKRRVISDSARNSFIQQLSAFLNRLAILSPPIIFNKPLATIILSVSASISLLALEFNFIKSSKLLSKFSVFIA